MFLNNKGFVLLETLVVTIFTLIIFTLLYTSVVPLLGRYKELSYYDSVDITYDLYYFKNIINSDDNFTTIRNNSKGYQKITCEELNNDSVCNDLETILGFTSNTELVYLNMEKKDDLKNDENFSSDLRNYLDTIDTTGEVILLQKDSYVSYLNIKNKNSLNPDVEYGTPFCTITISNNNSESGITTSVSCNPNGGSDCKSDNPTGDVNLKTSKTYTVYNEDGKSSSCTVNVSSKTQKSVCKKATWGNTETNKKATKCTTQTEDSANANLWNYVISCSVNDYTYGGTCTCTGGTSYGHATITCSEKVYDAILNAGGCKSYCINKVKASSGSGSCTRTKTYTKTTKSRTGCSSWTSYTDGSCSSDKYKTSCRTIYIGN